MGCCKFGENWDKSPEDMIVEAAYEAYADAGIEDPQQQIEAVFAARSTRARAPPRSPTRSSSSAARSAWCRTTAPPAPTRSASASSRSPAACTTPCWCVGFDKPKDRGVSGPSVSFDRVRGLPATPAGWFSLCAARYFETYGAGREDLAKIAVKNHHNGTLAPKSMLKREITVEDVLQGAHHLVAVRPLRLRRAVRRRRGGDPHARELAQELPRRLRAGEGGHDRARPRPADAIRTSTSCAGSRRSTPRRRPTRRPASPIRSSELDVAQVHDCFTLTELLTYEDLGSVREGLGEGAHRERHLRARRRAAGQHRRRPQDLRPPDRRHRRAHDLRELQQLQGKAGKRQVKNATHRAQPQHRRRAADLRHRHPRPRVGVGVTVEALVSGFARCEPGRAPRAA